MSNVVNIIMDDVPAGLDSMYVRVEEDAITQGVRNVLYSGVKPVSGSSVQIDIGTAGNVGDGVIVSADNYTSGGTAFKAVYGYSLIESGGGAIPIPKTYDAYVLIGDSITNQCVENRETILHQDFVEAGFDPIVEVYGSGLSGHTTKTFTEKFLGIVPPTTSSKLLSDYETLLAGKKVLFIDVLRTNDWKEVCVNAVDYATQKAECEQWTETLANAIKNSSLDADYAIASQPYNDWRNIDVRGAQGFDIIDGNAAQYDQTVAWQTEVVEALCQQHSPDWFINGKCFFDLYAETRNYFRYWFGSDTDSIHPVINSADIYRVYFANKAKEASDGTYGQTELYDYNPTLNFNVGDTCVFDFARTYENGIEGQEGYLKSDKINLMSSNRHRESTIKKSDGTLIGGRSYVITSGDNTRQASGYGTGDDTITLNNHYLLESASYVNAGDVMNIKIVGLLPNSTVDISITAMYNSSTSTSKLTANGTVISLGTTKEVDGVKPIATGSVVVDNNGEINATFESLDGLGFGVISGMSVTRTA